MGRSSTVRSKMKCDGADPKREVEGRMSAQRVVGSSTDCKGGRSQTTKHFLNLITDLIGRLRQMGRVTWWWLVI